MSTLLGMWLWRVNRVFYGSLVAAQRNRGLISSIKSEHDHASRSLSKTSLHSFSHAAPFLAFVKPSKTSIFVRIGFAVLRRVQRINLPHNLLCRCNRVGNGRFNRRARLIELGQLTLVEVSPEFAKTLGKSYVDARRSALKAL
jgi:hypothetical protein